MLTRRSLLSATWAATWAAPLTFPAAVRSAAPAAAGNGLRPYASEAELTAALDRWRTAAQARQGDARRKAMSAGGMPPPVLQAAPAAPAAPAAATGLAKSADGPARAAESSESITNVQTAGVDEGGIVKRAGDHLVILRRGRLFTVRVGGDQLAPIATIDAFAPGSDPSGAWYDELLVSGSTLVVVGYSYARGGTEIGLFDLATDGSMSYRATYHLRSFDYYSSRNYASRLIGRKLVFYSPTLLQPWGPPAAPMPGFRRWRPGAVPGDFERILPATRVYRTDDDFEPGESLALHTVTVCDLDAPGLKPESTAVLGPAGRVFYVSQGSVFIWTAPWRRPRPPVDRGAEPSRPLSAVYRIPLDGAGAPTGLKTAGVPIDQMSFLEDGTGHLNVLLRDNGDGEGMWGSERASAARLALLRVPLSAFGDGRGSARREHYRVLPALPPGPLQNRFVGDWLLYGGSQPSAAGSERVEDAAAWALRFADGASPQPLAPGHTVERIEAMGEQLVLVGNAGADLHFSAVRLGRGRAALAGRHVESGARQGETRSHGFFFRPTGAEEGLLGLPVLQPGAGGGRPAVYGGGQGAASVVYLRQREGAFSALGSLRSRPVAAGDDACRASCVDWYGNARPIFLGDRVFALLGYEIVEGSLAGRGRAERIEERRRIGFAPGSGREGRHSPFN